ncbi:MAG: alpha/beta fold hydrolase [Candidatus Cyclonatronum sp.]|uniref:alpha/beta fold hydrolase n=1 Tax=Cyclonatronum sp. TaxID=3024185 RepID=UPI0025C204B1|nr:alpha/beta fold hydrolase [Cyclonatronum sp.]MCH8485722.1 alpha/beta fold hydrolase [Cyclonatronum sp.]
MTEFTREGLTYRVHTTESKGAGPALMMLHGFAGSHQSFAHLLPQLEGFSRVMCPDLAGHGGSLSRAADPTARYATKKQVLDLRQLLREQVEGPLVVYGYSMGARLALQLAVSLAEQPETGFSLQHLVLESGTAGLRSASERRQRREQDRALAQRILTDFEGFDQSWDTLPVFESSTEPSPEINKKMRDIRRAQDPVQLAASLRAFGTGSMPALHGKLGLISAPVTLLTGACDSKFSEIARELLPLFGSSQKRHLTIPDCGHRVHLENPTLLCRLLSEIAAQK